MDPKKPEELSSPLSSSSLSDCTSPGLQSSDPAFSLSHVSPSSTQSVEILQLRIRELERELHRRRISLNLQAESTNVEALGRSCSDCLQGKDVEVMRLQVELAGIKVTRDRKEAEYTRERNSLKDENSRLRVQLESAQTDAFRQFQELARATELANTHVNTIETLTQAKESLAKKVALLEDEVYSEKEHASEVQRSTSEALKQLLAAKTFCESELETLREQHLRCITNSSKVEQNLRAQIAEIRTECEKLREKQPVPMECAELGVILETKNSEISTLKLAVSALEDKLLNISAQLAQERTQNFTTQNLLYQDNATLRSEKEALKEREATDIRISEDLQRQTQLNQTLMQRETELKEQANDLQVTIDRRDRELHRRQGELEEQKMMVRRLEEKLEMVQNRLEDKLEAQKSAEAQYICDLTKEKIEAEKLFFTEVTNRAKLEDRLFSREKHLKQLQSKYEALKGASDSGPWIKRRSFQFDQSRKELQSPFKPLMRPSEPLFSLEETKEPPPLSTEVDIPSRSPGKLPDRPHPLFKEAYTNVPCNCQLW